MLFYAKGLADTLDLDVEVTEVDVAPMQIQGPRSKELLEKLVGPSIRDLRYYHFTETDIDGIPVVITRTGWTSEVGYELYLTDASRGTDLYERVMQAGEEFGIKPTGPVDIRRIEGGIFNWGADMTWKNNPLEITGLERLVDWDLPDEAVLSLPALRAIRDAGVTRKLVGVEIGGGPLPELNFTKWPVDHDGAQVGKVTSAIYSPRLQRNIGYAWVPIELAQEGTELLVHSSSGDRSAVVGSIPFVDPGKAIPVG